MTGVLNQVFGAPVSVTVPGDTTYEVTGIFRLEPTEAAGADNEPVLISTPVLKIARNAVPGFGRGCEVRPSVAPGTVYRVVNQLPTSSPAADGFVMAELELMA